jgi:hypothetical protein
MWFWQNFPIVVICPGFDSDYFLKHDKIEIFGHKEAPKPLYCSLCPAIYAKSSLTTLPIMEGIYQNTTYVFWLMGFLFQQFIFSDHCNLSRFWFQLFSQDRDFWTHWSSKTSLLFSMPCNMRQEFFDSTNHGGNIPEQNFPIVPDNYGLRLHSIFFYISLPAM